MKCSAITDYDFTEGQNSVSLTERLPAAERAHAHGDRSRRGPRPQLPPLHVRQAGGTSRYEKVRR